MDAMIEHIEPVGMPAAFFAKRKLDRHEAIALRKYGPKEFR